MKTLSENYLSLAAFNYKCARRAADSGDMEKCQRMIRAALYHDGLAVEEAAQ